MTVKYILYLFSLSLLFYSCVAQQNRHQKDHDLRTRAYHAEYGKRDIKKIHKKRVQSRSHTLINQSVSDFDALTLLYTSLPSQMLTPMKRLK